MLFRYPGGKTKLLPALRPYTDWLIQKHQCFTDAFVGGGSVLLDIAERYPKIKLQANDLNENIASFWTLMARGEIRELMKELDQPVTVDHFYKLRTTPAVTTLDKAYRAVFFNRTTFSGIDKASPIGGKEQKSKWKITCRYNYSKICTEIRRISMLVRDRLEVTCLEAETTDFGGSVYYDPPYYVKGHQLYSKYMTESQHRVLANKLRNTKDWLLSYDDCEAVRKLYSYAEILELDARYSVRGEKINWATARELLIVPKAEQGTL